MRDPAGDDGLLADWLAHYAARMLLIAVVITVAATAWAALAVPRTEMWSIVVDSEQDVPARQLGVVGEALFQAEDTYAQAIGELGLTDAQALYDVVTLRSVPESRLLLVVARADDVYTASTTSATMARALVDAFERSGYPGLRILGAPQPAPTPSGLSVGAIALIAAVTGIVVAFAAAIVDFRVRRPVLTLHRAAAIIRPEAIGTLPSGGRLLGSLRHRSVPSAAPAGSHLETLLDPEGSTLVAPGMSEADRGRLAALLGISQGHDGGGALIACEPGTRERDLDLLRTLPIPARRLLWIG